MVLPSVRVPIDISRAEWSRRYLHGMWRFLVLASWLATGVDSSAPDIPLSIRWGELYGERFVLAPETPVVNKVPPTKLQISNWPAEGSSDEVPYFMLRPDKTITLHSTDFCVEASGYESGDLVRINHCTGAPAQLWNVLPMGHRQANHISLDGTTKCLGVPEKGSDAFVELRECSDKGPETWQFEKLRFFPVGAPSSQWEHVTELARDLPSSTMRHAMITICSITIIMASSIGAGLWKRRKKKHVATATRGGAPLNIDQGGLSLTMPLALQLQGTLTSVQKKHRGDRSMVNMMATITRECRDLVLVPNLRREDSFDQQSLMALRVTDLKAKCKSRGLKVGGKKRALVRRLQCWPAQVLLRQEIEDYRSGLDRLSQKQCRDLTKDIISNFTGTEKVYTIGYEDCNDGLAAKQEKLYSEAELQRSIDDALAKQAAKHEAELKELRSDAVAKQAVQPCRETFSVNDPVHKTVTLPHIAKQVIDTKIFQRMRRIKQLSVVHFVYPGAVHDRFMHSIGTAHLAYSFMKTLQQKQPELLISVQDVLCVTIAALCHDLGHPCFSHMFEDFMHEQGKRLRAQAMSDAPSQGEQGLAPDVEARICGYETWNHEAASVRLLRDMFMDLQDPLKEAGLDSNDLECILELVEPPKKRLQALLENGRLHAEWSSVIHGRPVEKAFLYEIVSNWRSGVDVDKFDYFERDAYYMGMTNSFQHDRFMSTVKVVSDSGGVLTISPPEKEHSSVREVFEMRKFLHSQAYSHKTSVMLSNHLIDILMMMDDHVRITGTGDRLMKMSEAALEVDPIAYLSLTDAFIEEQLLGRDPGLALPRAEYQRRFIDRNLMRLIAVWDVPSPGEEFPASVGPPALPATDDVIKQVLLEYGQCAMDINPDTALREVVPSELRCQVKKIHGGMGERDPIRCIHFHPKHASAGVLDLAEGQTPSLLRRLFIFWNPEHEAEHESDETTFQRLTQAFRNWKAYCIEKRSMKVIKRASRGRHQPRSAS